MKFKKTLAALATVGTGLSLALAGSVVPAVAATGTYGYDYNAHIVTGGGSDTTYKMMVALSDIYNTSSIAGCVANTSQSNGPGQAVNMCTSTTAPTTANANYERDTVAQASPTGSGAGIASLNSDSFDKVKGDVAGNYPYQGASSPNQIVDFARSSRAPNTTGGNCVGGNELTCDTFWGYAEDGVQVFGFGSAHSGSAINLTPAQLYGIYSCSITTWGALLGTSDTQPIVPFGLNKASGTYSTFNNYLIANGGAPKGFTVNDKPSGFPYPSGGCVRELTTGNPFENDVKPLFADVENNQGGLSTGGVNDPNNWFWFGSYGLLSAFPYDNNFTSKTGTSYSGAPDQVNGIGPSSSTIFDQSYPIVRTLFHVTPKASADCPTTGGACDFAGNPGPTVTGVSGATGADLNVAGATGGTAGAVREFTRFLCRSGSLAQPVDPYTGTNLANELTAAKTGSGFTSVPTQARTAGSSCDVRH